MKREEKMQDLVTLVVVLSVVAGGCALAVEGGSLAESEVEKVADGFKFTEGPMWHPDGYLIFSDIPADTIFSLREGETDVFRRPSGNSNGLTFDNDGRLIACEHGNRRVSRTEPDGRVVALAARYEGKRLNSPNDVVVKSDGAVYFTDPPYGVRPDERELDFQGLYRISPEGELTLLADDFNKPNGLAFSPDEEVLYVADTQEQHVRAFDVQADGTLANGRVFYEVSPPERLGADGMKVDTEGNLYIAATDGVVIVSPQGEHLETIPVAERPANLAFGDDGRTLYLTAQHSIYRVRTKHAGTVYAGRFLRSR
jgi:gluconolactonase